MLIFSSAHRLMVATSDSHLEISVSSAPIVFILYVSSCFLLPLYYFIVAPDNKKRKQTELQRRGTMSQKGMEKKKEIWGQQSALTADRDSTRKGAIFWCLTVNSNSWWKVECVCSMVRDEKQWKNKEQAAEGVVAHFFTINMGLMKDT